MHSENPQIDLARKVVETTDTHLFLTGKAGTGKTTFLRYLRKKLPKRMVVLAPTGIAAINAEGATIHSFFQLPFAPFVPGAKYAQARNYGIHKQKLKLIRSIDLLVIDEISMVRADLLDAVDDALRRIRHNAKPFGGVQLLLIGDLQQLAPVVKEEEWNMLGAYYDTPYFFSSRALRQTRYVTVELEHVYRQSDEGFLSLLNAIREGKATRQVLDELNRRYVPGFRVPANEGYIRLVTHNWQAHQANVHELENLNGKAFTYSATVKGVFPESSYPTDKELTLKKGAQVMFVKNDPNKQYYNGMIGEVVEIHAQGFKVRPNMMPGQVIEVQPEEWSNMRYGLDGETQEIKEVVEGTFVQFPVKLAWAITIHKSQGLTFERVLIDVSGAFAHGQTYVALSRCKSLEGVVLTSLIPPEAIIADNSVDKFSREMRSKPVVEAELGRMRNEYALRLLTELYTFEKERISLAQIVRIFEEFLMSTYPDTMEAYKQQLSEYDLDVMAVSGRFHGQYQRLLDENEGEVGASAIQARLQKGAAYFMEKLSGLKSFQGAHRVGIDNAEVRKRYQTACEELDKELDTHLQLLGSVKERGFELKDFLNLRAKILIGGEDSLSQKKKTKQQKARNLAVEDGFENLTPDEVKDKPLYYKLGEWRKKKAMELGIPVYSVLKTKAMIAIANEHPRNAKELSGIPSLGKKGLARYGLELLGLLGVPAGDLLSASLLKEEQSAAKPIKERTNEHSLRLYQEGLSIDDIARQRNLKPSTIKTHLASFLRSGEVNIFDLVPREHFVRISDYLKAHPRSGNVTLSELRLQIGEDISFDDLRLTMERVGW